MGRKHTTSVLPIDLNKDIKKEIEKLQALIHNLKLEDSSFNLSTAWAFWTALLKIKFSRCPDILQRELQFLPRFWISNL